MTDTLLFDLDGTLIPYWQDAYLSTYFESIRSFFSRMGFDPDTAFQALYDGCQAMLDNDGSLLNRDACMERAAARLGDRIDAFEPTLDLYYRTEFQAVKQACPETRDCAPLLHALRDKGYRLVLATNPLFPLRAIETRLSWVGLAMQDFDHITTYDNNRFCKPKIQYYEELLKTLGVSAGQCLMIGNNILEDLIAGEIGIPIYLVRDYVENPENADPLAYRGGSYQELSAMLEALPAIR